MYDGAQDLNNLQIVWRKRVLNQATYFALSDQDVY